MVRVFQKRQTIPWKARVSLPTASTTRLPNVRPYMRTTPMTCTATWRRAQSVMYSATSTASHCSSPKGSQDRQTTTKSRGYRLVVMVMLTDAQHLVPHPSTAAHCSLTVWLIEQHILSASSLELSWEWGGGGWRRDSANGRRWDGTCDPSLETEHKLTPTTARSQTGLGRTFFSLVDEKSWSNISSTITPECLASGARVQSPIVMWNGECVHFKVSLSELMMSPRVIIPCFHVDVPNTQMINGFV